MLHWHVIFFRIFEILILFILLWCPIISLLLPSIGSSQIDLQLDTWKCLQLTLYTGIATAILTSIIASLTAFLLARTSLPYRIFWLGIIALGMMIPTHTQSATWIFLCGNSGLFTPYILTYLPGFSLDNVFGLIFIYVVSYLPIATLVITAGLWQMPSILEEQTALYLNPWQRFWWVILPQLWPSMAGAGILVFALSSGDMSVSDVLGIHTLAREIYVCLALQYRLDRALVMSLPLIAISACIVILLWWLLRRTNLARLGIITYQPFLFHWPIHWCIVILLVTTPYLFAIPTLLYGLQDWNQLVNSFQSTKPEIIYSLILGISSGIILTIAGFILAWRMQQSTGLCLWLWLFTLLTLLLLPPTMLGLGLLRSLQIAMDIPILGQFFYWLSDTPIPMVWGFLLRYLPHSTFLAWLAIRNIPKELIENMRLLGCSPCVECWQIFLLSHRQLIVALLILSSFLWGELETSIILIPPGTTTITIRIFTLMHYGVRADVCAGCLWLIVCMLCALILSGWLLTHRRH